MQPVKVLQHRCDVLIPRRSMYQSGVSIEHRLKSTELWMGVRCVQYAVTRSSATSTAEIVCISGSADH